LGKKTKPSQVSPPDKGKRKRDKPKGEDGLKVTKKRVLEKGGKKGGERSTPPPPR